jgi:hypothetical protein
MCPSNLTGMIDHKSLENSGLDLSEYVATVYYFPCLLLY